MGVEAAAPELAAVEDGPVGTRELGCGAPVAGDGQRRPVTVVEAALDEPLVQITLAGMGAPRPREIKCAGVGAQTLFFAALARCAVGVVLVSR